jgi:hypothetical protein
MPHLTFSIKGIEYTLDVLIGVDGKTMAGLQAAGQPIPAPVRARGQIDTGTDVTAVAPQVLQQLGLVPVGSASTQTAGGPVSVNVFEVSLTVSGPGGAAGPMLVRPNLLVTELATPLPNIDVLIGLDILSECLVVLDGPGRQFTLAF